MHNVCSQYKLIGTCSESGSIVNWLKHRIQSIDERTTMLIIYLFDLIIVAFIFLLMEIQIGKRIVR